MRSSDLLTDVRRAMGAPNYQARFSAQDVLDIASSQQINYVVPEIRSLRRDFFVESEDFSLATDEDTIHLPERAAGRGIRDIWFTDTSSPTIKDFRKLIYTDLSDLLGMGGSTGEVKSYYFQADDLKIYPPVPRASTIRLFYLSRPGNLVEASRTATVLTVGTDTLTVDAVPSNIVLGSLIDVVKVKGSFKTLVKDQTVTARAFNSVTVAGYDFTAAGVSVGDIVSLARETSVVQLPEDAHEVLVWATAQEMAASLGIEEVTERMDKQLAGAVNGMRQAFLPRSEDPQVIINPDSLLRSGYNRFGALLR
jgi:hypothetical protein